MYVYSGIQELNKTLNKAVRFRRVYMFRSSVLGGKLGRSEKACVGM